jgi:hypothetical protein
VAPLRAWLHTLAADREQRAAVVRQTLTGALASLEGRVAAVADAVAEQDSAARELSAAAHAAYADACSSIDDGVRGGALLRGEVLSRWQEFVGTGEWMRSLQSSVGRLRDRLTAALTGRPTPAEDLSGALETGVATLLRAEADRAAERTTGTWRALPGGAALLGEEADALSRVSSDFPEAATAQVRDWQGGVLDLVRELGADKRTRARLTSWGVNGAGAVVMVAVFASTGGLTGGEIAVAGGTTALGQRLLEAMLGDAAVRSLADRAREDLLARTDQLLQTERDRFDARIAAVAPAEGAGRLREAVAGLAVAVRTGA